MSVAFTVKSKASVHAESVRVGIKLAFLAQGHPIPQVDVIERILERGKGELELHEFPLEVISAQTAQRREMRRAYAIKAMEVLLHKASEGFGSDNAHEKLVDQAWSIAAQMERHDNSGLMLDVLEERAKGKK